VESSTIPLTGDSLFDLTPATIWLFLAACGGVATVVVRLVVAGRREASLAADRGDDPPPVTSPPDCRPAEASLCTEGLVTAEGVAATVLDLVLRGRLVIPELTGQPERSSTGGTADPGPLAAFEQTTLDAVGSAPTTLEAAMPRLEAHRREFSAGLIAEIDQQRWFLAPPDRPRRHWRRVGILLAVAGVLASAVGAVLAGFGLVGLPLLVGGAAVVMLAGRLPVRTARGRDMLGRCLALRRFLAAPAPGAVVVAAISGDAYRLMPWAVGLGVGAEWAGAISGAARQSSAAEGIGGDILAALHALDTLEITPQRLGPDGKAGPGGD